MWEVTLTSELAGSPQGGEMIPFPQHVVPHCAVGQPKAASEAWAPSTGTQIRGLALRDFAQRCVVKALTVGRPALDRTLMVYIGSCSQT